MFKYIYPKELNQVYAHYANHYHEFVESHSMTNERRYWKFLYKEFQDNIYFTTGKKSLSISHWVEFLMKHLPMICVSTIEMSDAQNAKLHFNQIVNASIEDQSLFHLDEFYANDQKICLLKSNGTFYPLDEQTMQSFIKSLDLNVTSRFINELLITIQSFTDPDARPNIFSMIHYPLLKVYGLPLKSKDDRFDEIITFSNGKLDCVNLKLLPLDYNNIDLAKSKGNEKVTSQIIHQSFDDAANYINLDCFKCGLECSELHLPPQIKQSVSLESDLDEFFDQYFLTIADNDETRAHRIKQLMLATILQMQTIKKAVFIYGRSGTGKSTLLRIFESFHQPNEIASFNLSNLNDDDALVTIRNSKLITGSDNPDLLQVSASMSDKFRRIISHEPIDAFEKYKSRALFINHALMLQAMNDLPIVEFAKSATNFLERIIVIHIDTKFRDTSKEVKDYHKNFLDESTHAKLIGYLFKSLSYFTSIVDHPDDLAIKDKINQSNSAQEFINECVENGLLLNAAIPVNIMRALYLEWMKQNYPTSNALGKMKLAARLDEELSRLNYQKVDRKIRLKTLIAIGAFNPHTCQIDALLDQKLNKFLGITSQIFIHNDLDTQDLTNKLNDKFMHITKEAINLTDEHQKLEWILYALKQIAHQTSEIKLFAQIESLESISDLNEYKDDLLELYDQYFNLTGEA